MKYLALGLLLLVGCASKPKDNTSAQRALQTFTQSQINAHNKSVGEVGMSQGDGRGMDDEGPADKDTLIIEPPVEVFDTIHVTRAQWEAAQMLYPNHLDNNGDPLVDPRDGQGLEQDIYDNTVQPCEKGTHWEVGWGWNQYGEYLGCVKNTPQDDNYMIRFPKSLPEAEQLLVCVHGLCNWESYCDHAKKGQECVQRRKP